MKLIYRHNTYNKIRNNDLHQQNYVSYSKQLDTTLLSNALQFIQSAITHKLSIILHTNYSKVYLLINILNIESVFLVTKWVGGYLTNFINNRKNYVRHSRSNWIHTKYATTPLPDALICTDLDSQGNVVREFIKLNLPVVAFTSDKIGLVSSRYVSYIVYVNKKSTIKYIKILVNTIILSTYKRYLLLKKYI